MPAALGTGGQGKVVLATGRVAERRLPVSPAAGTPARVRVLTGAIGCTATSAPDRGSTPAKATPRRRVVIPAIRRAGGSTPALARAYTGEVTLAAGRAAASAPCRGSSTPAQTAPRCRVVATVVRPSAAKRRLRARRAARTPLTGGTAAERRLWAG